MELGFFPGRWGEGAEGVDDDAGAAGAALDGWVAEFVGVEEVDCLVWEAEVDEFHGHGVSSRFR